MYVLFLMVGRERFFSDLEKPAGEFFGSLAVLMVTQISLVVRLCRLVNWRRDRIGGYGGGDVDKVSVLTASRSWGDAVCRG